MNLYSHLSAGLFVAQMDTEAARVYDDIQTVLLVGAICTAVFSILRLRNQIKKKAQDEGEVVSAAKAFTSFKDEYDGKAEDRFNLKRDVEEIKRWKTNHAAGMSEVKVLIGEMRTALMGEFEKVHREIGSLKAEVHALEKRVQALEESKS